MLMVTGSMQPTLQPSQQTRYHRQQIKTFISAIYFKRDRISSNVICESKVRYKFDFTSIRTPIAVIRALITNKAHFGEHNRADGQHNKTLRHPNLVIWLDPEQALSHHPQDHGHSLPICGLRESNNVKNDYCQEQIPPLQVAEVLSQS